MNFKTYKLIYNCLTEAIGRVYDDMEEWDGYEAWKEHEINQRNAPLNRIVNPLFKVQNELIPEFSSYLNYDNIKDNVASDHDFISSVVGIVAQHGKLSSKYTNETLRFVNKSAELNFGLDKIVIDNLRKIIQNEYFEKRLRPEFYDDYMFCKELCL